MCSYIWASKRHKLLANTQNIWYLIQKYYSPSVVEQAATQYGRAASQQSLVSIIVFVVFIVVNNNRPGDELTLGRSVVHSRLTTVTWMGRVWPWRGWWAVFKVWWGVLWVGRAVLRVWLTILVVWRQAELVRRCRVWVVLVVACKRRKSH